MVAAGPVPHTHGGAAACSDPPEPATQVSAAIEQLRTRDDPLRKLPQPRGEVRAAFRLRASEGAAERAARMLAASRPATAACSGGGGADEAASVGALTDTAPVASSSSEEGGTLAVRANALPSLACGARAALQSSSSDVADAEGFRGLFSTQLPDDPLGH